MAFQRISTLRKEIEVPPSILLLNPPFTALSEGRTPWESDVEITSRFFALRCVQDGGCVRAHSRDDAITFLDTSARRFSGCDVFFVVYSGVGEKSSGCWPFPSGSLRVRDVVDMFRVVVLLLASPPARQGAPRLSSSSCQTVLSRPLLSRTLRTRPWRWSNSGLVTTSAGMKAAVGRPF
jgi:hypothetical protein